MTVRERENICFADNYDMGVESPFGLGAIFDSLNQINEVNESCQKVIHSFIFSYTCHKRKHDTCKVITLAN